MDSVTRPGSEHLIATLPGVELKTFRPNRYVAKPSVLYKCIGSVLTIATKGQSRDPYRFGWSKCRQPFGVVLRQVTSKLLVYEEDRLLKNMHFYGGGFM